MLDERATPQAGSEPQDAEDTQEGAQAEPQERPHVSIGFVVPLYDEPETMHLPGSDDGTYFITAQRCSLKDEDKIAQAGYKMAASGQKVKRGQAVDIVGALAPGEVFFEKCTRQITDFCLPVRVKDNRTGKVSNQDMRYNAANRGDNSDNRKVYEFMADERIRIKTETLTEKQALALADSDEDEPLDVSLRDVVEGFLDTVHGRDTDAREDFSRLGNALRASQTTM
jgi:hypothetical protein